MIEYGVGKRPPQTLLERGGCVPTVPVRSAMSNPAGNEMQVAIALLQAELARLRDSSGEAWRNYLTWFTWFFTTQVFVAGWVISRAAGMQKRGDIAILAGVFVLLNVWGVIAAARQRAYCRLQKKRAAVICEQLAACAEKSGVTMEVTSGFAGDLVDSALTAFSGALIAGDLVDFGPGQFSRERQSGVDLLAWSTRLRRRRVFLDSNVHERDLEFDPV